MYICYVANWSNTTQVVLCSVTSIFSWDMRIQNNITPTTLWSTDLIQSLSLRHDYHNHPLFHWHPTILPNPLDSEGKKTSENRPVSIYNDSAFSSHLCAKFRFRSSPCLCHFSRSTGNVAPISGLRPSGSQPCRFCRHYHARPRWPSTFHWLILGALKIQSERYKNMSYVKSKLTVVWTSPSNTRVLVTKLWSQYKAGASEQCANGQYLRMLTN
jgi:hypothetical protein